MIDFGSSWAAAKIEAIVLLGSLLVALSFSGCSADNADSGGHRHDGEMGNVRAVLLPQGFRFCEHGRDGKVIPVSAEGMGALARISGALLPGQGGVPLEGFESKVVLDLFVSAEVDFSLLASSIDLLSDEFVGFKTIRLSILDRPYLDCANVLSQAEPVWILVTPTLTHGLSHYAGDYRVPAIRLVEGEVYGYIQGQWLLGGGPFVPNAGRASASPPPGEQGIASSIYLVAPGSMRASDFFPLLVEMPPRSSIDRFCVE